MTEQEQTPEQDAPGQAPATPPPPRVLLNPLVYQDKSAVPPRKPPLVTESDEHQDG